MDEGCNSRREEISLPGESEVSESSTSSSSTSRVIPWHPRPLAFRPYSSSLDTNAKPQLLRVVVRRPLVARLTKDIVEIYQICNPQFRYSEELNPKRYLTSPSVGLLNDGCDNANSDLILTVNYSLVNSDTKRRYIVKDILGHGTFGQVAKCWVSETNSYVAVKIIKNLPAYYHQALVEVSILTTLNMKHDPEDKHHIVRIHDYFVYQRHLCIAFELLDTNLYELIKLNHFRGLSLSIVQLFSKQILRGLALMKDAGIIHCDLKPENILLCTSVKPAEIKIIDFGSACMENRTVYSYIQSRYYRSPEVVLGYQYTTAIDMWSFGCIVAELFLGLPLFPGASEFDLLRRMIKILGGQPPDHILRKAKNTSKFFKYIGSINHEERDHYQRNNCNMYQVLTEEEYAARESKRPSIGKEYFNNMNLEAIVSKYPYRKNLPEEDILKESQIRLALIDFLRGLVEFDPAKRWSPLQASKHPFVTGEPFTCPYQPAPETPNVPVSHNVKVDHHPAGGHWFAAGLSPNVSGRNRALMPTSPHYQLFPFVHPGSYGSMGSHGSFNDSLGLGSSYGSYGDNGNFHAFYSPAGPSGMNFYAQSGISVLGNSPDARRFMQLPHGNGIGYSPGNFPPMSLGSSPSQFTPPGSYSKISTGSPGHYGPPSPVRGNCHGSLWGKMASGSHYNRRKNWAYHTNFQSQENTTSSSSQGQVPDNRTCCQSEGMVSSSSHQWTYPNVLSTGRQQNVSQSITSGYSSSHIPTTQGSSGRDQSECNNSLPDPGDWDPNYSEELLLQEDSSQISSMASEFIREVNLSQPVTSIDPMIGGGRFSRIANGNIFMHRNNGPVQSFPHGEASSNPAIHSYAHVINQSYIMPHLAQSSPSRLGQRHIQQHNLGRSAPFPNDDWSHLHVRVSEYSGGPQSPGRPDSQWGPRGSYSVSNAPPPVFHERKDCGRKT
ncbi:dual specificity protein kinase YAK1 homolog isoform X2 [Andrographis paniculata]|uniref:dual specificity protein kinase YAK1 homolog isoform X2 n=1 Tax=Andrographis paniculata TaxID=175694 RepID=UPI0021E96F7C|nr:dual specificity protein kinase YAK1 homolog isoform X2 [Andrographis paniculata]